MCLLSLSTEFAECGSLYDYLKSIAIDYRQILLWAKQIALGTVYLYIHIHVHVLYAPCVCCLASGLQMCTCTYISTCTMYMFMYMYSVHLPWSLTCLNTAQLFLYMKVQVYSTR